MDERVLTCRIERWRGYATSRFYALIDDGTLFESKPFRWRRDDPPPREKAQEAYDELARRLEAAGWKPVEDGEIWYATTFARTVPVRLQGSPLPERTDARAAAALPASAAGAEPELEARRKDDVAKPAPARATVEPLPSEP